MLFFAEMWERFSYYGMRGLLIFYLTEHFLFDDEFAQAQYASYTTLVYLLPLVGGYLADRYLGSRKAIAFGALLLVAGHFTMAHRRPARDRDADLPRPRPTPTGWRGGWTTARSASRWPPAATRSAAAPDGGLAIKGLPAGAPLPPVLPKGAVRREPDTLAAASSTCSTWRWR